MRKFFSGKKYVFERFASQIILYIFPLKNIGELRENERGFYSGLY